MNNIVKINEINAMINRHNVIEQFFNLEKSIPKNDFLQLITIDKSKKYWDSSKNETYKVINSLPEQIDYETFVRAIVTKKIEDKNDEIMFDLFLNQLFELRKKNPALKRKMDEKIGLDMIPSYSVELNEYGDVKNITRNLI